MAVDGSVSQLQLYGRHLAKRCLGHIQRILLSQRKINFHRRVVRHGGQHRGGIHQGTFLIRQRAHHTGSGTLYITEAQHLLGRGQTGLSQRQGCLCTLIAIGGRLELEVTDHLALEQFLGVLIAQLRCITGGLRRVYRSLRLTHLRLVGHVVDHEEHLSGTHRLTFLDIDLRNEALYLRTDLHVLHTLDSGRIGRLHLGT